MPVFFLLFGGDFVPHFIREKEPTRCFYFPPDAGLGRVFDGPVHLAH